MTETDQVPLTGEGHAVVAATDDLSTYWKNPRVGSVDAIAASLTRTSQYRPIVVNAGTRTGRPLEVLAGNHTLLAARQLGWPSIMTWQVDVDEDVAARIVAADNRTADLGTYDEAALIEVLSAADGLEGTGYSENDLVDLLKRNAPAPERDAPEEFPTYDDDTISTDHECPRCGYQWSGATS